MIHFIFENKAQQPNCLENYNDLFNLLYHNHKKFRKNKKQNETHTHQF